MQTNNLDPIDLRILRLLQEDGMMKLKDISSAIHLSVTPTHDRIRRLENEGYIQQYAAHLDRKKLDLGLMVHCHVTLDKQTRDNFSVFKESVAGYPEVVSCCLVSGNFDFYLKIVTRDMDTYNRFYQEKLAVLPMIAHINSLFVMDEIKETTALPI